MDKPDFAIRISTPKMASPEKTRAALEAARHELTTLHGLLAADGACPAETWTIDTSRVLELIDAALSSES